MKQTYQSFLENICRHAQDTYFKYPHLFLSVGAVLLFIPLKILIVFGGEGAPFRLTVLMCALAFSAFFLKFRHNDLSRQAAILQRGIVILFGLYLLFAKPPILFEDMPADIGYELAVYHWGMPIIALFALWRPALAIPLLLAAKWQKFSMYEALSFPISVTDYSPVLEFGLLITIGFLFQRTVAKTFKWNHRELQSASISPVDAVLLTAVAVHFSNYFYSGIRKIEIGESLFKWILENPTYYLSLAAEQSGSLPITLLGSKMTEHIIEWSQILVVPINAITLVVQLMAIFAITRIRWTIVVTALYDVTHIVIFFLSGIFFYKWIILNLLIVGSLSVIRDKEYPKEIKFWLLSILLAAPLLFFVAFLGWYDTPSFNDRYLEAITRDGKSHRVPSNYMLGGSVFHAQQRFGNVGQEYFSTGTLGALHGHNAEDLSRAMRCEPTKKEHAFLTKEGENQIAQYLQKHERYVLKNLDAQGRIFYDLYPHHIFSMPWSYKEFYALDKRDIVGYRYRIDAKCLKLEDGHTKSILMNRNEYYVPIQ